MPDISQYFTKSRKRREISMDDSGGTNTTSNWFNIWTSLSETFP